MEQYDWNAIVDGLNRYLRLRSIPIGMKLFETVEEMEAIPKIRRPRARHTTDQVVAQARQLGWTVGITMADLIGAQCGADQVGHRDADGPAQMARLGDDLIGCVPGPRTANLRDRLHLLDRLEELHADRDRAQPQISVEAVDDRVPVILFHDTLHRSG